VKMTFLHLAKFLNIPREVQPEQRIHFVPGAMRNPGGVSYKAKPQ